METPKPNIAKILDHWMEWERGEAQPGRVLSNMKTAGLREILDGLAEVDAKQVAADAAATK